MKKSGASVFWTGARLGIPVILGYIPVGIAYALIARLAGFSVLETCMMSVFVYAGASEMMAAGMYAQGAGIAAIVTQMQTIVRSSGHRACDVYSESAALYHVSLRDERDALGKARVQGACGLRRDG